MAVVQIGQDVERNAEGQTLLRKYDPQYERETTERANNMRPDQRRGTAPLPEWPENVKKGGGEVAVDPPVMVLVGPKNVRAEIVGLENYPADAKRKGAGRVMYQVRTMLTRGDDMDANIGTFYAEDLFVMPVPSAVVPEEKAKK